MVSGLTPWIGTLIHTKTEPKTRIDKNFNMAQQKKIL